MDLITGQLLWEETLPEIPKFESLEDDLSCDVAILGGGMGGVMCAWYMTEAGFDTVLLEKRTIGDGSSSANTGLLQFSNDMPLVEMAKVHGKEEAVHFYNLCRIALDDLDRIAKTLPLDAHFKRRRSLYFASNKKDVKLLEEEYKMMTEAGFPVDFLSRVEIETKFPFSKPAALYTHDDAEVNPVRFVYALLEGARARGLRVYEHTEVIDHEESKNGHIMILSNGKRVSSKNAIIATGYETQEQSKTAGSVLESSYAIATSPAADFSAWNDRCLIWETARPYLYLRTTNENRIIVGGLDISPPEGPERDRVLLKKADKLFEQFTKLFPMYSDLEITHRWTATFGSTKDGMPFIGRHPKFKNCYYALGYGGNGTIYYAIAGPLLRDIFQHKDRHEDEEMLDPARMRWYRQAAKQVEQLFDRRS